jgi:hypothetical protein
MTPTKGAPEGVQCTLCNYIYGISKIKFVSIEYYHVTCSRHEIAE